MLGGGAHIRVPSEPACMYVLDNKMERRFDLVKHHDPRLVHPSVFDTRDMSPAM